MDGSLRLSRLIEELRRDGHIEVAEIAARFGTAEITVRRDLDVLVERGIARRIRGGAENLLMRGEELPFVLRELEAVSAKRAIAAAVAELLRDGEAVGLDSGTTVVEVATKIRDRRLTVLPVSLHAAMACASGGRIRLILPGGEARPGELAMVGAAAVRAIEALRFDTAVMSCCAIDANGTVMAHDPADAAVKQALLGAARRRLLAVDSTKLHREAMAVVSGPQQFDGVVTDAEPSADALKAFAAAGAEIHHV